MSWDDEYLTVMEIAEHLRLNAQTVRNWIDRGELPAVRAGRRRVRVRRSDLDSFINASSTRAADRATGEAPDARASAWAGFGHALATTTIAVEEQDQRELVGALKALSKATRDLAHVLEHQSQRPDA